MTRLVHALVLGSFVVSAAVFAAGGTKGTGLRAGGPDGPEFTMSLSAASLELSGQVSSDSHADTLTRLAAEHFPRHEIETLLSPAPVEDIDWQVLTLAAVFVLAETSAGRLVLRPDSLELDGIFSGRADLLEVRISRVEKAGGGDFSTHIRLHEIDAAMSAEKACARMFRSLGRDDIRFHFGTTELRSSAHAVLDRYVEFAIDCPGAHFLVTGHTDSSGDEALNLYLSEQRAGAVRDYLVAAGIEPERLSASGKGSDQPVADNATAWGRSRNRRIEVELAP